MLSTVEEDRQVTEVPAGVQVRRPLLGQLLLAHRMVTPDELREALCRQQESGGLLGEILVEMGALTTAQLDYALEEQQRLGAGTRGRGPY